MSAFGRAMLDQVAQPHHEIKFGFYAPELGSGGLMPCRQFITVRPEEERLIRESLREITRPRVLDIGCGIGRHSSLVRTICPAAEVTLVDTEPDLLAHACAAIPGSTGYAQLVDVPASAKFDLVFLLGNGLGVFGTEPATVIGLKSVAARLSQEGCALIESGTFIPSRPFSEVRHTLTYGNLQDEFMWGYATRGWVRPALTSAGLREQSTVSSTVGHDGFFIVKASLAH
jgi:SAM-dependent methyltransferase